MLSSAPSSGRLILIGSILEERQRMVHTAASLAPHARMATAWPQRSPQVSSSFSFSFSFSFFFSSSVPVNVTDRFLEANKRAKQYQLVRPGSSPRMAVQPLSTSRSSLSRERGSLTHVANCDGCLLITTPPFCRLQIASHEIYLAKASSSGQREVDPKTVIPGGIRRTT